MKSKLMQQCAQFFFCASAVFATCGAWAEKADATKPMQVEADKMTLDDAKQQSVLTGNVILTRGTLIMKAERVNLKKDAEGYQYATALAAPGKLASYRQKRDDVNQFWEGYAEKIEYDDKNDTLVLTDKAVIKRLEGTQLVDEVRGAKIVYDNRSQTYTVVGGGQSPSNNSGNPDQPSGRVRMIIDSNNSKK